MRLQPIGLAYLKAAVNKHLPGVDVIIKDYHAGCGRRTVAIPKELLYLKDYYPVADKSPFSTFDRYYHFGKPFDAIEQETAEIRPDVVGISSLFTPYFREVLEISARVKKHLGIPVVVGGSNFVAVRFSNRELDPLWGAGLRFGAQHSQSIENWAMAIPGLKVVAPSTQNAAQRVTSQTLPTIVFVLVEGILIWTILRYRARPGNTEPKHVHGNTTLEILWTAIPALILAFIALLWPRLRDRRNQLTAALAVALALSLVPVTAAGVPVLAAGLVALAGGLAPRRRDDATEVPVQDDLACGKAHP